MHKRLMCLSAVTAALAGIAAPAASAKYFREVQDDKRVDDPEPDAADL